MQADVTKSTGTDHDLSAVITAALAANETPRPAQPTAPEPAPERLPPASGRGRWVWGLGGFLAGVAVWHAIGFWAFLAYLVGGGQHPRTSLLADIVLSKSRDQIAPSAVAGSQPRTTTISGRGEAFSPSAGSAQIVFASHERCTTLSLQRSDGAVKPQACDPGVGSVVPRIAAVRGDLQVARTDWTASVAAPEWAAEVDATADRAPTGGQRTATPRIAEPSGAPRAAGAWSPVVQSQRPSSITTGSLD